MSDNEIFFQDLLNKTILSLYNIYKKGQIDYNVHYDLFIQSVFIASGIKSFCDLESMLINLNELNDQIKTVLNINSSYYEISKSIFDFLCKGFYSSEFDIRADKQFGRYLRDQGLTTQALIKQIKDPNPV